VKWDSLLPNPTLWRLITDLSCCIALRLRTIAFVLCVYQCLNKVGVWGEPKPNAVPQKMKAKALSRASLGLAQKANAMIRYKPISYEQVG
jgi:hypothetical protein